VALGQSLGLYDKVGNDLQMNKASAAQMIYNVLTAQLVQVDANSTVKYLYDSDDSREQSLLTTSLNCFDSGAAVVTWGDAGFSLINLYPQVGAYGVLYRSKDPAIYGMAVALTKVRTQFLSGRFIVEGGVAKFQSVDGTKYNLGGGPGAASMKDLGDKNFHLGFTSGPAFFLNGDEVALSTGLADEYIYYHVGDVTANQSAKLVVAAEVVGLTITNLHSVAIWEAKDYSVPGTGTGNNDATQTKGEHFLYEAGQIAGNKFNGHNFPLDVSNEVDHNAYILKGVDSIDDLAADNVVYVYKNSDKTIRRIDVGTATQAGTVTNVNTADYMRTIGGTTLVTAPYSGLGFKDVNTPGNEGTALLDVYGRIYDFKLGDASKGNFAVVVNALLTKWGVGNVVTYKIVDKTGKEVSYDLSDDDIDKYDLADTTKTGTHVGNVIEYKISGGKLNILSVGKTGKAKDSVNEPRTLITIDGKNLALDSNALVFVGSQKDGYNLGSVKDLRKEFNNDYKYIADSGVVKALAVSPDDAGAQSLFVLINSISPAWDGDEHAESVAGLGFKTSGVLETQTSWIYKGSETLLKNDTTLAKLLETYDSTKTTKDVSGLYPTIVKFSIDENGVLKGTPEVLAEKGTSSDGKILRIGDARVLKSTPENNGSYIIKYTTTSSINAGSIANGGTNLETITTDNFALTENATLFKIDGSSWASYKIRDYNFDLLTQSKIDSGTQESVEAIKYYTFLKSAADIYGYDIVIEQVNYVNYK
jgi:hypothetical protein